MTKFTTTVKSGKPAEQDPKKTGRSIDQATAKASTPAKEYGGPKGPEPTRYGDWEKNGRCSDF